MISIGRVRSRMYRSAKFLGDVQAVQKGRVTKRIGRRIAGKYTGRGIGKAIKPSR